MIIGLGIDLIEVSRIEAAWQKFGERFINRVLLPSEIAYCLSHRHPGPYIAARFAAKEAASKAFGTGIGALLSWHDLEVARKSSGEPFLIFQGKAGELFKKRAGRTVHLTITHTSAHAVAAVILEG